jgi:hypothetical protein
VLVVVAAGLVTIIVAATAAVHDRGHGQHEVLKSMISVVSRV